MAERREVRIAFLGDASDLKRATQTAERSLQSFEVTSKRISAGIGTAVAGIAAAGAAFTVAGVAAGIAGKSFVDAASSYEEAASKAKVVFGAGADKVVAFTKTATRQFGISERSAMDWAGTLGALLRPMGLTEDAAADMSTQLTGLAGDFASFYNTSPEDALIAIRAGLVGESEPLRRYGVLLNEARVKQEAMTQGLYDGKGELSAYARAQAVMSLILKDSVLAQGDYVRTQDSTANKLRLLGQEWDNFKVAVGTALLPLASWIAGTGVKILNWLTDMKTAFDTGGWGAVWDKLKTDMQKGWDETVFPWLEGLPAKIGAWAKDTAIPAIGAAMSGLGDALVDWAANAWEGTEGKPGLKSKLESLFKEVDDWLAGENKPLSDKIDENVAKPFNDWIDDVIAKTPEHLDAMMAAIEKWLDDEGARKAMEFGIHLGAAIIKGLVGELIWRFEKIQNAFIGMIIWLKEGGFEKIGKAIEQLAAQIVGALFQSIADLLPDPIKDLLGNTLGGLFEKKGEGGNPIPVVGGVMPRAMGGPVTAGRPYLVGERGPELFMPGRSGTIVPNGAGNTYNIDASGLTPGQAVQVIQAHERMALAGAA